MREAAKKIIEYSTQAGYFGVMVPRVSVKPCHFERSLQSATGTGITPLWHHIRAVVIRTYIEQERDWYSECRLWAHVLAYNLSRLYS